MVGSYIVMHSPADQEQKHAIDCVYDTQTNKGAVSYHKVWGPTYLINGESAMYYADVLYELEDKGVCLHFDYKENKNFYILNFYENGHE